MRSTCHAILVLVFHMTAKAYVVNHEFCSACLSEEEKETLEEVHTFAQLKTDPCANLPLSFMICSSVMTTSGFLQIFFNMVGKDGNKWFVPFLTVLDKTSFNYWSWANVTLPPVFAHQWTRSCMSVHSESGLLQWVVDGILVKNSTVPLLKDVINKPTDLSGKIVLGVWQEQSNKRWSTWTGNQVANLNLFSTTLAIEKMKQFTMGGGCAPECDYLAWREMQWNLKGQARIETVDEKEPCMGDPSLSFYPAQRSSREACIHLCQKLGRRSPAFVTLQSWTSFPLI